MCSVTKSVSATNKMHVSGLCDLQCVKKVWTIRTYVEGNVQTVN